MWLYTQCGYSVVVYTGWSMATHTVLVKGGSLHRAECGCTHSVGIGWQSPQGRVWLYTQCGYGVVVFTGESVGVHTVWV